MGTCFPRISAELPNNRLLRTARYAGPPRNRIVRRYRSSKWGWQAHVRAVRGL